jgi:hypothetical protein
VALNVPEALADLRRLGRFCESKEQAHQAAKQWADEWRFHGLPRPDDQRDWLLVVSKATADHFRRLPRAAAGWIVPSSDWIPDFPAFNDTWDPTREHVSAFNARVEHYVQQQRELAARAGLIDATETKENTTDHRGD